MKKTIILLLFLIPIFSFSQNDYSLGIGVRTGFQNGLDIKKSTGNASAIEAILAVRWNSFQGTLLFERASNLGTDPNFNLFYGIGGHLGSYNNKYDWYPEDGNGNIINIGLDAIVGIEYTFAEAPFALSLDVKPAIDLIYLSPIYMGAGFSIKYIIR